MNLLFSLFSPPFFSLFFLLFFLNVAILTPVQRDASHVLGGVRVTEDGVGPARQVDPLIVHDHEVDPAGDIAAPERRPQHLLDEIPPQETLNGTC